MSQSSHAAAWRLIVAPDLSAVPGAAAAVRQFLMTQGCSEKDSSACELALVEGCNNAILHGRAPVPALQVEISCQPLAIELRITDHTQGFDWPEHLQLPCPEEEKGRGLYLIASVMDSAEYRRGTGRNVLVLHKRRARQ